jgi:orotate phosphoribosyltransferase
VAIVDDVATTGGSILKAIDRVQHETDWQIAKVLCLVDRQEGAREKLAQAGYELTALFTGEELGSD